MFKIINLNLFVLINKSNIINLLILILTSKILPLNILSLFHKFVTFIIFYFLRYSIQFVPFVSAFGNSNVFLISPIIIVFLKPLGIVAPPFTFCNLPSNNTSTLTFTSWSKKLAKLLSNDSSLAHYPLFSPSCCKAEFK